MYIYVHLYTFFQIAYTHLAGRPYVHLHRNQ